MDVHAEAERRRVNLVEHERRIAFRFRVLGEIDGTIQGNGIANHRAAEAADGYVERGFFARVKVDGHLRVTHEVMALAVKYLDAAVVGIELELQPFALRIEILPVLLQLLLTVLAAPLADFMALNGIKAGEIDRFAPILRLFFELVHVGRRAHEVDFHIIGEMDGNGRVIDIELANRRGFEVLGQYIPDIDAEIAAWNLENEVAFGVVPGELGKINMARDVRNQPFDFDGTAQHILIGHGVIKNLGSAAADDFKGDEDDGTGDEQGQAQKFAESACDMYF